ncbi:hypothetical protein FPZ12_014665 [Amycolatopsis acidicola]|uniref:Uncharacterized protein n=1 Tax=Amycolatopsis acidicola TaxID=2596893 RepID=A0A5N0V4N9_9PSEU|nr:hypothetical protein [Amycolatopsis acidicola]KAA9161379.1 hypothetical protein FPZ12_014665 [Amycolatopsis acidicola]
MAASPADVFARRLGLRTGRLTAVCGLVAIVAAAVVFLLPPHSTIAAIVLGIAGVAAFGLGMARQAGGPWWALVTSLIVAGLLFAALTIAGRGVVLHAFGVAESCEVTQRQEVDTQSRYQHYGFVHTLSCPRAGTLIIRTDSTDRQRQGSQAEVLDDPGGLLEPDFAGRHGLLVDVPALVVSIGLVAANVVFVRRVAIRAKS